MAIKERLYQLKRFYDERKTAIPIREDRIEEMPEENKDLIKEGYFEIEHSATILDTKYYSLKPTFKAIVLTGLASLL